MMSNRRIPKYSPTVNAASRANSWHRRDFLKGITALGGSAGLLGYDFRPAAAEPPPETSRIRLLHVPVVCFAPEYLAEELLRLEGFSEVDFVKPTNDGTIATVVSGQADIFQGGATSLMLPLDAGLPITVLAGIHFGCWELFANGHVGSIRDLKGKRVAVTGIGGLDHVFLASIMSYIGMDPRTGVDWVSTQSIPQNMRVFLDGKVDAFLAFAQQPEELRERKIGRTLVNTTLDRPWSQYFCCMVAGNQEFVRKYPVATKRALRALLKATDICANAPERAANYLVSKGYISRYDLALTVLKTLPYDRWRQSNPEDTLRFHALRLKEVGMIKSSPQKLIAQGTDWSFLNALKKELKS